MTFCQHCGAQLPAHAAKCDACGAPVSGHVKHDMQWISEIYNHIPHPHIHRRKQQAPAAVADMHQKTGPMSRFNAYLAVKVTNLVGTMWCAYAFAVLALISLPDAVHGGTSTLIAWIAQTFLQLVLLSIIIVGQKVAGEASDKRSLDTYNDAEAVLHEAVQIQQHLAAQDALMAKLIEGLSQRYPLSPAT